ncbi:MAG: 1-acyl-sn-glycerol-3-phosphate acyltransferase [Myxococcales bacterium]|nr:1-acyl-sn-glycerol-3-phosphate acyltransferase [Myxococcales bacterium]
MRPPLPDPRPISPLGSFVRHAITLAVMAIGGLGLFVACVLALPFRGLRLRAGTFACNTAGPIGLRVMGTDLVVHGRDEQLAAGPAIYVANHSSDLDPLICMTLLAPPSLTIAKWQFVLVPIVGQLFWLSGNLPIDRSRTDRAKRSMARAAALVARYRLSLWIWPEGTQPHDGQMLPLKKGFAHLALATGLPVVPVIAHGAHLLQPARSRRLAAGTLHVTYGPRIDTSDWRPETLEDHTREVERIMKQALGQA